MNVQANNEKTRGIHIGDEVKIIGPLYNHYLWVGIVKHVDYEAGQVQVEFDDAICTYPVDTIKHLSEKAEDFHYIDIAGAGRLRIGKKPNTSTINKTGFQLGVSWGRHGYAGGVLDREAAKRLVECINNALADDAGPTTMWGY